MDRSAPGRSCVAEQGGVAESEFSGARVEISGALSGSRLDFQETEVVVRGAAQGRWAEGAGHCKKGPGQRRGQAGEVSGAKRGIVAQRRGVGCRAGAV